MENKNTILAIVLMAAVWLVFTLLGPKQAPVSPGPETVAEKSAPVAEQPQGSLIAPNEGVEASISVAPNSAPVREIVVENDLFAVRLNTSGGRLTSFVLKNFRETTEEDSPLIAIVSPVSADNGTLRTNGNGDWILPSSAVFSSSVEDNIVLSGADKKEIVLSYSGDNGLIFEKTFKFSGDSYDIDFDIRVQNRSEIGKRGSLNLALVHPWDESQAGSSYDHVGPSALVGEDLENISVKSLAKETKTYLDPAWTAFENKYFMAGLAPHDKAAEKVVISKAGEDVLNTVVTPEILLSSNQQQTYSYSLYFGPRDLDILRQVGHGFDKAIDFGWFTVIAMPLRTVLNFFYGFVKNYGIAIILLTVIIKMLFWPLTHKSYASMKEMQKIQPEIQKLRDKYKNNREKMNQEVMALYKEKRVNPFGGCLPMVVQIPVFFALYRVLMLDIALRQAPFLLWINDMSAPDTLFTDLLGLPFTVGPLPLIMGGTMYLQQKMTPSTMDPNQAKLFMLMPVVFTFMFLNFPSGLVLYWLVNNVLTIVQQYFIHRKFK